MKNLGVVLSDSRVTPTRLGTVGVAVSHSGIRPTIDMRGKSDLCGNSLKVTLRATADQLATAAQLVMGEANEAKPVVLIRGFHEAFEQPRNEFEEKTTISPDQVPNSSKSEKFRQSVSLVHTFATSIVKSDPERFFPQARHLFSFALITSFGDLRSNPEY